MRMWNARSAGRPMWSGNFPPSPREDAVDPVRAGLPERARGDRSGRRKFFRRQTASVRFSLNRSLAAPQLHRREQEQRSQEQANPETWAAE